MALILFMFMKRSCLHNSNQWKREKSEEIPAKRPWEKNKGFEDEVVKTIQGINASLQHLTSLENQSAGQDKSTTYDEDSLILPKFGSKIQKNSNIIEIFSPINILKTINDMEVYVQQQKLHENMVHKISPQLQYGNMYTVPTCTQSEGNASF